ncbi:MAG: hypothetical protein RMJ33_10665 [Saprospiraceae bacterium]|nr:hypothetical protein [Saprospiraceae bacterium]MDW8230289.1 hypothetical protein [Saprospiraceae bacterium]
MTTRYITIWAILFLFLASACGSKSEKKSSSAASSAPPAPAGRAAADDPKFSFNDPVEVEAAQKRQYLLSEKDLPPLSTLLPARIGRYKKTYEKNERGGPEVMLVYSAWAEYTAPEGNAIVVHITDTGQRPEMQQNVSKWARTKVDIQNERGYEKSITFDGYPGFEKHYPNLSSEVGILVADRYIVNAACLGCDLDLLREAIRTVPLKRLEVLQ